ncbi:MAG: UbiA family prenyltransferase [Planctomycetota bacterium]
MRGLVQRFAAVFQLTRVTGAFAAVANVWFVIAWSRSFAEEPGTGVLDVSHPWILYGCSAVSALGLYAFGATLNDVIDAKRDRTLRPNRPLAAERISIESALSLAVGTLLVAILGAAALGMPAVLLTVLVAGAITAYNAAGRFVPAFGLPMLSVVYAGHMIVPNVNLVFTWPVVLVMTHALLIGLVSHLLERRSPRLSVRAVLFALAGWALSAAWLLWSGPAQQPDGAIWPEWTPLSVLAWVGGTVVLLVIVCVRRISRLGSGPRVAEKIRRYGSLWPAFYACAWLVGAGQVTAAVPLIGLAVAGVLGMTLLREAYSIVEQPLEFRA